MVLTLLPASPCLSICQTMSMLIHKRLREVQRKLCQYFQGSHSCFRQSTGGPWETSSHAREQIMGLYGSHKSRQSNPSSPGVNCNYSLCPFRFASSWDNYAFQELKASLRSSISVVVRKCSLSMLKGAELKTLKTAAAFSVLIQNACQKVREHLLGVLFRFHSYLGAHTVSQDGDLIQHN